MKKKIATFMAAVALCGIAATGTYAYLTGETNKVTNVFSSSEAIKAEIIETNFNQEDANAYLPGQLIPKNPTLMNTSKNEAVYGALKLSFWVGKGEDAVQVSLTEFEKYASLTGLDTSKWTEIGIDAAGNQLFMFNDTIGINTSANPELFQGVKINPELDVDAETGLLPSFNVKVEGYIVQSTYNSQPEAQAKLTSMAGFTN